MSIRALNLLIDSKLMTSSGKPVDIKRLSRKELSFRISNYIKERIKTSINEVNDFDYSDRLSALWSTSSTVITHENILSSSLIYDSIVLNDPLVSISPSINSETIFNGLKLFSWAFELIKAGFIRFLPLDYFNRPNDIIPLLYSDDSFKSDIPSEIYDFIHNNAILKSVIRGDDDGEMYILDEDADVNRRRAIHVSFKNDSWDRGVQLYMFQTVQTTHVNNDRLTYKEVGDPHMILGEEKFNFWKNQVINQAIRARLNNIYSETNLATKIGHTYITESEFEAQFLAMAGICGDAHHSVAARFLDANNSFINIESPEKIVKLRTKYETAFMRFNYSLQDVACQLDGVSPDQFDAKAKSLFSKEILPQIDELKQNVSSLHSNVARGTLATLSGISLAVATGSAIPLVPSLLLCVASGLTETLPALSQRQILKGKPAFIWHRITKT